MKKILPFLLLLFFPEIALSEPSETGPLGFGKKELTKDFATDRPDFTESVSTVEAGHLQGEFGYTFSFDDEGGDTRTHEFPQTLLRVGLLDDLELRLGLDGVVFASSAGSSSAGSQEEGMGDTSIGFKKELYAGSASLPSFSFIGELGLPTGAEKFSSGDVVPALKLLFTYDLNESTALSSNINFEAPIEDTRYFETQSSFSIGKGLTDELSLYAEYFGLYPSSQGSGVPPSNFLNGGFTYLVSENVQLDSFIGFGLNKSADDLFCGLGVSFRI